MAVNYCERLHLRGVTANDHKKIDEIAGRYNISRAEVVRALIDLYDPKSAPPRTAPTMLVALISTKQKKKLLKIEKDKHIKSTVLIREQLDRYTEDTEFANAFEKHLTRKDEDE